MNDIKTALKMLPLFRGLYARGILAIQPSNYTPDNEYIQIREEKFRECFPDIEPDENGYLTYYIDGVKILALTNVEV